MLGHIGTDEFVLRDTLVVYGYALGLHQEGLLKADEYEL